MKKAKRVKINVPAGVSPVDLERCCERLYEFSSGESWSRDDHCDQSLIEYHCGLARFPEHHWGCVEFFDNMNVNSVNMRRMAVEMFGLTKDAAERVFRSCVISSDKDEFLVDFECFLRKCANYRGYNKVSHGTRYHIYCHPAIRDFLSTSIWKFMSWSSGCDDPTSPVKSRTYRIPVRTGRKEELLEIDMRGNCVLEGFTGQEYALLMSFWSCHSEGSCESMALSSLWETMHRGEWSSLDVKFKKGFLMQCVGLTRRLDRMYSNVAGARLAGRSIDLSSLLCRIEGRGYEKVGSGGNTRIVLHDCDKVSFVVTRPELLYMSKSSVVTLPDEVKSTMAGGAVNIYLSYRVLRKIKMGDKASNVILSETIEGLFGEWSRKSAKHHMERLKQAGYIKEYRMTRRGIEFDAADEKISNEKKETEK